MLIALVLPAPLGPRSPNTSPRLIARFRHSTATFGGLPPCSFLQNFECLMRSHFTTDRQRHTTGTADMRSFGITMSVWVWT